MAEARMESCCLHIDFPNDIDCESMKLWSKDRILISPNSIGTLQLLFINNYIIDRKGSCEINIIHAMTNVDKHTIKFDVGYDRFGKLHTRGIKPSAEENDTEELSFFSSLYETLIGNGPAIPPFKKCVTHDLDTLRDCQPVDCEAKYSGYRNYFNEKSKKCEKVPICSNLKPGKPHTYYDMECNCCKELTRAMDEMEMISLTKLIQASDSIYRIKVESDWLKNYPVVPLIKCVHGVEMFGGLSCDCDDQWTTYSFDSRHIVPGKDVVEMCNVKVDQYTTTFSPSLLPPLESLKTVKKLGIMDRIKELLFGKAAPQILPFTSTSPSSLTNKASTSAHYALIQTKPPCPCGDNSKIPKEICSCPEGFAPMIPIELIPKIKAMFDKELEGPTSVHVASQNKKGSFLENFLAKFKSVITIGPSPYPNNTPLVKYPMTPDKEYEKAHNILHPGVTNKTIVNAFNTRVLIFPTAIKATGLIISPRMPDDKNEASKDLKGNVKKTRMILGILLIVVIIITAVLVYLNWELVKRMRERPGISKYFGKSTGEKEKLLKPEISKVDKEGLVTYKFGVVKEAFTPRNDGELELKPGDLVVEIGQIDKPNYMTAISVRMNKKGIFPAKIIDLKNEHNNDVAVFYKTIDNGRKDKVPAIKEGELVQMAAVVPNTVVPANGKHGGEQFMTSTAPAIVEHNPGTLANKPQTEEEAKLRLPDKPEMINFVKETPIKDLSVPPPLQPLIDLSPKTK
ncbi:unnamed protein product [Gordionus sp. m RMFG-2023]